MPKGEIQGSNDALFVSVLQHIGFEMKQIQNPRWGFEDVYIHISPLVWEKYILN